MFIGTVLFVDNSPLSNCKTPYDLILNPRNRKRGTRQWTYRCEIKITVISSKMESPTTKKGSTFSPPNILYLRLFRRSLDKSEKTTKCKNPKLQSKPIVPPLISRLRNNRDTKSIFISKDPK